MPHPGGGDLSPLSSSAFLCARAFLAVAFGLCLIPAAPGAQRSRDGSERNDARNATIDPEAREKIDDAFRAFEELLAITKGASAMGTHARVRLDSWRSAQETWERASAQLPASFRALKCCALALGTARGFIEQADALFLRARDDPDAVNALRLLAEHKRLLARAQLPLKRADRSFRAARSAYVDGR
jgi:hypothetical protein